MNIPRSLAVCFLVLIATPAWALDPSMHISQYAHTAWRIQDGVLPGLPEAITQTADGYLWIGTFAGLVRFDGVRFVPWEGRPGEHLPDSRIFSVLGARDGSLWIGTPRGLARWKDGRLVTLPHLGGRASSIIEDHHGTIWVGRTDVEDDRGALCHIVGNDLKFYGERDGVPVKSAYRIAEDGAGYLWVGGYDGLTRWKPGSSEIGAQQALNTGGLLGVLALAAEKDGTLWAGVEAPTGGLEIQRLIHGSWSRYQLPGIKGEPGVTSLFIDQDQSVWIGTARRGIYRVNGNKVDHFDSGNGLSSDAIAGFFQDREGTLWVATSKGVDRFREFRVVTFSISEGLTADSASSVHAARNGGVWIGNSGALDFWKDGKLSAIRTGQGLPGRDVTTLFEDRAGRLWIGVDRALWVYDGGIFRLIDRGIVLAVTEDRQGTIWARVGPKLDRIENLKVKERIGLPQILNATEIMPDAVSGIWLGLKNGDLMRYRDSRWETFPAMHGTESGIRALLVQSDGSVWAATQGGLLRWKEGTSKLLTTRHGLPCNDVYALVDDGAGSLWLYANCGVIALAMGELDKWWTQPDGKVNPRILDVFDGAQPGLSPPQPQATRSTDGRLWFANNSVLQMFDPKRFSTNPLPPPVRIERIVADQKIFSTAGDLNLPARTRDLEIDYAALSFVVPEKVRYRYRLEGRDSDWQEAGTRRQAFYSDLRPGQYRFSVIACNNDGVWNDIGATLSFSVAPAWYQTNWFLVFCVITALFVGWSLYRLRVRQIARAISVRFDERLAERTRLARELHDTFLQTIQGSKMVADDALEQSGDPIRLRRAMEQLSVWLGQAVNEGRAALNSLRTSTTEKNDLAAALQRATDTSVVHRSIAPTFSVVGEARDMHPIVRDEIYRIGYEAIRNASAHSGASRLDVKLIYQKDLVVRVKDNGKGIDPVIASDGKHGHFGLKGMRERALRIGAKLTLDSSATSGTEIILVVPGDIAFRMSNPLD